MQSFKKLYSFKYPFVYTVYLDWTEENIEQFISVLVTVLGGEVEGVALTY